MSWLVPPSELTPEQQRAVQLSTAENRAIIGGPGSGKTQVLLHRARHLSNVMKVEPARFRIFVYTNVLKDYIRSALNDLRLPEANVVTFDHWCSEYYRTNIGNRTPWDTESKGPDFAAIRLAATKHALASGALLFDFVLVDEGQDLEEEVFSFLAKVSRHVTVCLDSKQKIYDKRGTSASILMRLGIKRHNVNLIDAFRVCPYLVEIAAELIPDAGEREAFRNQTRQPQTERETPLLYLYRSFEDERQKLQEVLRERMLRNERVGILLPQNRQVFGFAKGLREIGVDVEVPSGRKSDLPVHDFSSDRPKLMTIYSAKGLTFDTVLIPRLVSRSFTHTLADRVERLLFVAITRATTWCYLSTAAGDPLAVLTEKLVPIAKGGQLSVVNGTSSTGAGGRGPVAEHNAEGEDENDDIAFL